MANRVELNIDGTMYSVSGKDGNRYIKRIAPYDETEYHWAYYDAGKNRWTIYLGNPGRARFAVGTDSVTEIAKACLANDKALGLKRTSCIW